MCVCVRERKSVCVCDRWQEGACVCVLYFACVGRGGGVLVGGAVARKGVGQCGGSVATKPISSCFRSSPGHGHVGGRCTRICACRIRPKTLKRSLIGGTGVALCCRKHTLVQNTRIRYRSIIEYISAKYNNTLPRYNRLHPCKIQEYVTAV